MGGINLGKSSESSRSNSQDRVWDVQNQAFKDMYGHGNNMMNMMSPYMNMGFGMMPQMQQYMQQAMNMGQQGAQNQLGGGAYGDTSRYNDMIYDAMANPQQSNQSKMYENIVGGPGNTYADPLVDSMRQGMDQNRQAVDAQNGLQAGAMGQGGSNRHAMQNAMNNQNFNQDMTASENAIRHDNYGTDMNWKMQIAQQADSNRQADLNRAQQMVGGANQSQQFGSNYMPTMQNLGMGYMAPWMQAMQGPMSIYGQYANSMGDPTVLNNTTTRGKGSSYSGGISGGS